MQHDLPTLTRFMLGYLKKLTAEMTAADLVNHAGGANPPGWILGHLAVVADLVGPMLKLERRCPAAWHKAFGPTHQPSASMPQQSAAEWVAAIEAGYEAILAALPQADERVLAEPHGVPLLAGTLIQTRGQLLSHVLSTHLATHIGQLSAWRRNQGKPALF
jgi:hypothetical protein